MQNVLNLGPLSLNATVLFFVLSWVFWLWVLRVCAGKLGTDIRWLRSVLDGSLLAGLLGSRLMFALWYWESYRTEPWTVLYFWQSGYSLMGGMTVAILYAGLRLIQRRPEHPLKQAGLLLSTGFAVMATTFAALFALNLPDKNPVTSLAPVRMVPFEFQDSRGTPVGFSDYEGMPIVLNFWATWCPPCRREMPLLESSIERYTQQSVAIVAVNVGDSADVVRAFLEKQQLTLPVWQSGTHSTEQLFQYVNGQVLPTTLFIHPDGRIERRRVGELSAATLQQGVESIQSP